MTTYFTLNLITYFPFTILLHFRISKMAWKVVIFAALFMMHEANGKIGDYHSSSSPAFDEEYLESISRFYNIGIIKISFSKTSLYEVLHPNLN